MTPDLAAATDCFSCQRDGVRMERDRLRLDNVVEIVTPENIAFEHRLAGPFRRLPAYVVDLIVRTVLIGALAFGASMLSLFVGGAAITAWAIAWLLLEWFYGAYFESRLNGQTPGKRMMGIRVVSVDGEPISGGQALLRNVLRATDLLPPILPQMLFGSVMLPTGMVGLVCMTLSRRFQRLGDIVSRTMVVVDEKSRLTGAADFEDPRVAALAERLPAAFRPHRSLTGALAHYVARRRRLAPLRRQEVARHLAEPLARQLDLPANTDSDLLLCAAYYRAFVAQEQASEQLLEVLG